VVGGDHRVQDCAVPAHAQPRDGRDRVFCERGSSSAADAIRAAEVVARDVVAIDVNMGCNKHAAVSCGMGAALAENPAAAADMIKALVRSMPCPITAKIRLQETPQRTIELVRALEYSGASAVTIHCRRRSQGPGDEVDWSALAAVVAAAQVPVIGNGNIFDVQSAEAMLRAAESTAQRKEALPRQLSGIMLARGALKDCSVFSQLAQAKSRLWPSQCREELHVGSGLLADDPWEGAGLAAADLHCGEGDASGGLRSVIRRYAELSLETHMHPKNTKFVIQSMLHEADCPDELRFPAEALARCAQMLHAQREPCLS
jgi:tRNA-dihydrouridine synthase